MELIGNRGNKTESSQTQETKESTKKTAMILDDAELQLVSGGGYNIAEDPLYRKFAEIMSHECKGSSMGMDCRSGFVELFQAWVRDGSPENIRGWYQNYG